MKCRYCNADIEQDALFCPSCGKDLSKFDKCVKCGELLDKDTEFCPYCGTEQPHEIPDEKGISKKWWVIIALLLILCGIGGYLFLSGNSLKSKATAFENNSTEEVIDSLENVVDVYSVDEIKARMKEILNEGMAMSESDAVKYFFSKDFREIYLKVYEYDTKNPVGEIGYDGCPIWGDSGDIGRFHTEVEDVSDIIEHHAIVRVKYVSDEINNMHLTAKFNLVYENDSWLVDEVTDDLGRKGKQGMKEYIESSYNSNATGFDGIYSLAGKVSKYGIHMNIQIDGSTAKGYYYYDSQGSSNQVRLEGTIEESGNLKLVKFGTNGEETGYFLGTFDGTTYSGDNINYSSFASS